MEHPVYRKWDHTHTGTVKTNKLQCTVDIKIVLLRITLGIAARLN